MLPPKGALNIPEGLALRLHLYAAWILLLAIAGAGTVFFCGWQGFSSDGPPPGFKPEPFPTFFLKNFPFIFLRVACHFWWFSIPVLALSIREFRRIHTSQSKQLTDYDL